MQNPEMYEKQPSKCGYIQRQSLKETGEHEETTSVHRNEGTLIKKKRLSTVPVLF